MHHDAIPTPGNAGMAGRARRRARAGRARPRAYLIEQLIDAARRSGAYLPFSANTAYINTIPTEAQVRLPGDSEIEQRIRAYVRWNAMAMVLRANKRHQRRRPHRELRVGGRRSTTSASTTSGARHRRARRRPRVRPGPLGHRRLRARLHARPPHRRAARQLPAGGRRQGHLVVSAPVADAGLLAVPDGVDGPGAADGDLPGALHEVPAGPRPRADAKAARCGRSWATARWTSRSRWAPSAWPSRENLDNLIFVVNCNLQRLDGPVRGNGKIIQELESDFRGAGWNVIKVIWGTPLGRAVRARQEGHPHASG